MAIKVKVRIPFRDMSADREREQGDVFTCDDKRADYLFTCGLVWKLGRVEEEQAKPRAAGATKKQTKTAPAKKAARTKKTAATR